MHQQHRTVGYILDSNHLLHLRRSPADLEKKYQRTYLFVSLLTLNSPQRPFIIKRKTEFKETTMTQHAKQSSAKDKISVCISLTNTEYNGRNIVIDTEI